MMANLRGLKRRFSEDEEMDDVATAQAVSSNNDPPQHLYQHTQSDWKRNKTGIAKKSKLNRKLVNMDKEGLLQVLTSLLDKQPGLRHDILTYIPAPTISSALAVLNDLEKKLHASFPYNKNGPQLDHYTFSRVREPLLDLIDTISQYSHHFVSSMVFPTTSFTYLDQVSHFVHRLPIWNADQHNQPRMDLYKDMALFWKQAIQMASEKLSATSTFHPDTVGLWATNLAYHNTLSKGLLGDVILEFNRCFLPTPEHHDASLSATTSLVCQSSPVLGIFPSPVIGYTDHRR